MSDHETRFRAIVAGTGWVNLGFEDRVSVRWAEAEIDRLRARVAELEAEAAGIVPDTVPPVKPDRG
jgi:hypothetical protein